MDYKLAIYVNELLTNLTSAREKSLTLTNRACSLASPRLWPPGAASSFLRPRTCRSQGAARPRPISPPPAAWTARERKRVREIEKEPGAYIPTANGSGWPDPAVDKPRAARSGGRSKGGRRRGPGRRQRRGSRILRAPWRRARRGEGGDPKGERGEGRSRGAREGRSREREEMGDPEEPGRRGEEMGDREIGRAHV